MRRQHEDQIVIVRPRFGLGPRILIEGLGEGDKILPGHKSMRSLVPADDQGIIGNPDAVL